MLPLFLMAAYLSITKLQNNRCMVFKSNHPLQELCEELMIGELDKVEPDDVQHPAKRLWLHRVEVQGGSALFNISHTHSYQNKGPSKEEKTLMG